MCKGRAYQAWQVPAGMNGKDYVEACRERAREERALDKARRLREALFMVLPTDSLRERLGRLLREHGQAAGIGEEGFQRSGRPLVRGVPSRAAVLTQGDGVVGGLRWRPWNGR